VNVLVLDDDEGVLLYLQTVLSTVAKISHVSTARDAREFVRKMHTRKQHLIVSDIMMEGTSGPDILRKYKDLVGNTPIVLTSCSDDLLDIEDDLLEERFNVVSSFQKPIYPATIVDFLND